MTRDREPGGTDDELDRTEEEQTEDSDEPTVDEQSEQSFPASDPPSY